MRRRIPNRGIKRLMEDILAISEFPPGPHLTDQEIAHYMIDDVVATQPHIRGEHEIDKHTQSCEACTDKLCALFDNFGPILLWADTPAQKEFIQQRILVNLNHAQN